MGFIFNFIKRIIKLTIKLSLYTAVLATIIVLIPNLPPYTKFTSIEIAPIQPRVGPLAPNEVLNNAELKYKGKLLGPEAFQLLNGELYTSLATGEIVKISPGGHVTFVTKIGAPCSGLLKEHICGRPLGFQIDAIGQSLYVADAYHGIWKVDLKTDKKQLLVSPRVEIGKRQPKLFNSIALGKNGDFYWTDSTSDYHLKDGAFSGLSDPSGRLFHYNAVKNESKVLVDDLWFPNGLILSPDNEFIVVAETFKYRLLKHYIAGPKKGKTEVLIDGLPGTPDNVRVLPDGSGILVGLYVVFDEEQPLLMRSMASTPIVRKFLARLQRLIEIPFEYLNNVYPHVVFEDIVYNIGHFKSVSAIMPTMSGLLQADWNGNIVATYFNTDGSLGHISDAIVYNDKLYTGSPHKQDFIGAVTAPPLLKKAFESIKKSDAPKVEAKPQQAAKPVQPPNPKIEEKPKVEPKPKVEEKPKVEQRPKVEEKPKVHPKVQEKPKVEEKKEAPKVVKVEQAPKPAKPVETQKPVTQKPKEEATTTPAPPKTTAPPPPKTTTPPPSKATTPPPPKATTPSPPKATTPPPKATAPPTTTEAPKKAPQKEQPKPTTPKPEVKSTPPTKPAEKSTTPPPKATPKPEEPKQKPVKQDTPKPAQGKAKEQIPIKEDIPSDTAKPTKETLKVIKKGGVPTEIPVPNQ